MNDRRTRIVLSTLVLTCYCGWIGSELAFANARLTLSQMQNVVGGTNGCDLLSKDLEGYRCNSEPSMGCGLICSKCSRFSGMGESVCGTERCWKCEDAVETQIKECIVGDEEDVCETFGEGPEYGVCGFELEKPCIYDLTDDLCKCPTPVNNETELPCARKNCADL